mgnify:CR=1 FL=1
MGTAASTGRIAALTGPETVEVKEFDLPDVGPGAVLLAVRRANVCGTDVHQWHYESAVLREAGLGHEFVGEIVEVGSNVADFQPGDIVEHGERGLEEPIRNGFEEAALETSGIRQQKEED